MDRPYWPLVVVLGGLAFLQIFVLVGITQREGFAHRLGVGLCVDGGVVGVVLGLLAAIAWYFGRVFLGLGLAPILPNAGALALLTSESAWGWCEES